MSSRITTGKRRVWLDASMAPRFVFPVIAENMFTIMVGLITTQVISTISSSALAAIGMANSVMNVITAFFSMITTGAVLLVARQKGAGEMEEAADTVEQSLLLGIVVTSIVTIIGIVTARLLMKVLMPTAEERLFNEAVRYYRLLLLSLPSLIVYSMMGGVSRALDDSRTPLIATVLMNIVQIGLAYLLISALKLEEVGAALAYVGCRIVGMGILIFSVMGRNRVLPIIWRRIFIPKRDTIRHILNLGIPVSLESIFVQVGYLVAGSMSIALGTLQSTVYQIMNTLANFGSVPQGVCSVVAMTAVGHLLGAKKEKEARKAGNIIFAIGVLTTLIIIAGLLIWAKPLASIYSKEEETIARTASNMWMMIPYLLVCIAVNCNEPQLRAGGDVRFVMTNTVLAVWLIRIPLTYLFCFVLHWGEMGIYAANCAALFERSAVSMIRRSGKRWIKARV